MKLIINADDFGYSEGVNLGIAEAHRSGTVTSTTAMVTMPAIDHAVRIAKENPCLNIGLHLNITFGKPLTSVPGLVNEEGFFYKPKEEPNQSLFKKDEIKQEFLAQYFEFIKKFHKRPSHLDSHLYAHQIYQTVAEAIHEIALEKQLPVRGMRINGYPEIPFFSWFKVRENESEEDLLKKLAEHLPELDKLEYAEMMVHPAFADEYLLGNSSYNRQRFIELKVLTSQRMRDLLRAHRIELTNFMEATYGNNSA